MQIYVFWIGGTATATTTSDLSAKERLYMVMLARITAERNNQQASQPALKKKQIFCILKAKKDNICVLLYFIQNHTKGKFNFATLVSKITVEISQQKLVFLQSVLIIVHTKLISCKQKTFSLHQILNV